MWKLALRNVFRHKARTLLTLAAITFGVAALIISGGFVQDFLIQLREATIHSQLGHLQVYKAGYYKMGPRAPYKYMIDDPVKRIAQLRQLDHVIDITPRVNFSGLLSNGRTTFAIVGEAVHPEKELRLSSYIKITSGKHLPNNNIHTILLGQGVANALSLKPGDNATLLMNTREGALNSLDLEIVGTFQSVSKEYDDRAIRIPLDAAQELLATKAVHSLVFALEDTAYTGQVAAQALRLLPSDEFEIKTWYELADFYQKAVGLYERYFVVLRLIILGMVLLSVANSVSMTIHERTGEFGTLMALGNRGRKVFRLILAENVILGGTGGMAGVIVGIAVARAISAVGIPMPPMPNTNAGYTAHILLVPWEIVMALLVGMLGTIFAAVLPARRASRLPVVEALRQN